MKRIWVSEACFFSIVTLFVALGFMLIYVYAPLNASLSSMQQLPSERIIAIQEHVLSWSRSS